MPRIRSIKPEFWTSEQVLECSRNARLLFIGLWNFCDDSGRHPLKPIQIKAEIFPGDSITKAEVIDWLSELQANGLIVIYAVDNSLFLQVTGWHHQRIEKRQEPKYPGSDDGEILGPLQECYGNHVRNHSRSAPGALRPDRKGSDPIRSRKGSDQEHTVESPSASTDATSRNSSEDIERVFAHWQTRLNHSTAKLDDKRRSLIRSALKATYSPEQLCKAIDGCAKTPHNMGDNDRGQVYDGLHIILKPDNIDRFIANDDNPPRATNGTRHSPPRSAVDRVREANRHLLDDAPGQQTFEGDYERSH